MTERQPELSIIVPARDDEALIGRILALLKGLWGQRSHARPVATESNLTWDTS